MATSYYRNPAASAYQEYFQIDINGDKFSQVTYDDRPGLESYLLTSAVNYPLTNNIQSLSGSFDAVDPRSFNDYRSLALNKFLEPVETFGINYYRYQSSYFKIGVASDPPYLMQVTWNDSTQEYTILINRNPTYVNNVNSFLSTYGGAGDVNQFNNAFNNVYNILSASTGQFFYSVDKYYRDCTYYTTVDVSSTVELKPGNWFWDTIEQIPFFVADVRDRGDSVVDPIGPYDDCSTAVKSNG